MKKIIILLSILFLLGCAGGPWLTAVKPPEGVLFTHIKAPLTTNFHNTPVGRKIGSASTHYIHDIFFTNIDAAWDKAGLKDALENGSFSGHKIYYADYEYVNVFFSLYKKFTIHLYGE